jgi:hypothetical protein
MPHPVLYTARPVAAQPGRPRTAGRVARGPELAAALSARLTLRDRWLLRMLHEHRVLITGQITQLAFGTSRAATARLLTLYQLRAIDRFRPLVPAGSAPLYFVLDEAGAAVLAAEDGITPAELGYRRDRVLAIALSPQLAHACGANGVFTALAAAARQIDGARLECWWSERRCAALWGDTARPDGYGRWHTPAPGGGTARTDFFLEYDTGTENLTRLTAKLSGYATLAARTGITTPVLFWLQSARREAALRTRLAGLPPAGIEAASAAAIPGVPVATATPASAAGPAGPAGPAWLPAGSAGPRLPLSQLPGTTTGPVPPGQPDSSPGGLPWYPPSPRSPWDSGTGQASRD